MPSPNETTLAGSWTGMSSQYRHMSQRRAAISAGVTAARIPGTS